MAASTANQETYGRLERVWKEGMTDYELYQRANADRAWGALQGQMGAAHAPAPVARLSGRRPWTAFSRRPWAWVAAAAVVALAAGATWWGLSGKGAVYETVAAAKSITLADGTTVSMQPRTHLRVTRDRTVVLLDGVASFDVVHRETQPFTVDMDVARIRDIGTSFTVAKTPDSIEVRVAAGKVEFTRKGGSDAQRPSSGDSRILTAGDTLCLYTGIGRRGQIAVRESLRFDDAPLSAVVDALRARYGKDIRLTDTTLAAKRLTVHLDGASLAGDLEVVCASLNLDSKSSGDGYILEER